MIKIDKPNHLITEKSPYLLAHAYNPIDWFAWTDDAFVKAKAEHKPIFLSIGYSTCHWCHVMEHESFKDENVAKLLNDNYISIKVDREERPDVDSVYMEVCQALTGSGGWPLTVIMTPDGKPFFAGTYLPRHHLIHLLKAIQERWENDSSKMMESAEYIMGEVKRLNRDEHDLLDDEIIDVAYGELHGRFDERFGGFGSQPKFPTPHHLLFLLRYHKAYQSEEALKMVETTLTQMYKGGIFDHIGYGFSRYSVDHKWLVPHFEKMLYDNALLAMAYAECYMVTKKPLYKEVTDKIMSFVSKEMTSPEGAFYTAFDADSEGVEGKFYLWTVDEIEQALNHDDAQFIIDYFYITRKGNFENKNILNLIHRKHLDIDKYEQARFNRIREILYKTRDKRVHPHLDDKILTSWNAMMIVAFASIGRMFGEATYVERAEKAMNFLLNNLVGENNRLLARYRDQEAKYLGYLDDYAYLVWALIELFLATHKENYLNQAILFNHQMTDFFKDEENGGYFQSGKDAEKLIMNTKSIYDGAIPSGNSVLTMNLIRLAEITGNPDHEQEAKAQFNAFAAKINEAPSAYTHMLSAYILYKVSKTKIVLVSNKVNATLTDRLNQAFQPFATTIILDKKKPSEQFQSYLSDQNDFAMYVCQNNQCSQPIYNENDAFIAINNI